MLKDMLDQLGSLTLEEKRAVEEAARAAVARELGAQGAGAPESCPRRGCPSFARKGRNRDGSQRWPCRGCGSEENKPYPLVLNTGSCLPFYTHSKLREIPWLNQFQPEPVVRLHPKDARERGIENGDTVRVFNAQGEVQMKAEIANMVLPGVVDIFHGWAKANINLLISRDFCPITGYPPFRSSICEVEKIG